MGHNAGVRLLRAVLWTTVLVLSVAACSDPSNEVVNFGSHNVSDVKRAIDSVVRKTESPRAAKSVQGACARLEYLANSAFVTRAGDSALAALLLDVKEAGGYCESVLFTEFPEALPRIRLEMAQLSDKLHSVWEIDP